MKHKKPPPVGTAFLVPLRDQGYALGVLTRANGKGSAFGYFFGPRLANASDANLDSLTPENALLVGMFGDLELLRHTWPAIGILKDWNPSRWPVLPMARIDAAAGRAWVSTYDDDLRCIKEVEVDLATASQYPYDRMMGAGAVEIRLTKLIKARENSP